MLIDRVRPTNVEVYILKGKCYSRNYELNLSMSCNNYMLDEKFSMIENKYLKKGIDFSKESLRRTNSNCS